MPATRIEASPSDEDLMRDLAAGQQEALGPLYGRYAGLIYHLAAQSLERAIAEEVVQEVFLATWRSASAFDPRQGPFRPWLMQLTRWKILNELRRRRRRPSVSTPPDDNGGDSSADADSLDGLADAEPGPEERTWQHENARTVRAALDALPPRQRQAVALAFIDGLTHEEVARTLNLPLGTAKTRIRSGLQSLRFRLAPVAASLLGVGLAVLGLRYVQLQRAYERDERAIPILTISELSPLRLTPASSDVPAGAHANYRGRPGTGLVVLTTEALPQLSPGRVYQAWVRHADRWTSLGTLAPDSDGVARLIAEDPLLATPPDAVEISVESVESHAPSGQVVLSWPNP